MCRLGFSVKGLGLSLGFFRVGARLGVHKLPEAVEALEMDVCWKLWHELPHEHALRCQTALPPHPPTAQKHTLLKKVL